MSLVAAGQAALKEATDTARAGTPINEIGRAVHSVVTARGYSVCRDLTGHGIGRRIHEWPTVLNYDDPRHSRPLTRGLVITIEPTISAGTGAVYQSRDGWTIKTSDKTTAAHVEHTIVITDHSPILITA